MPMPISQKTPIVTVPSLYAAWSAYRKFVFYLAYSDWIHILRRKRGIIERIT